MPRRLAIYLIDLVDRGSTPWPLSVSDNPILVVAHDEAEARSLAAGATGGERSPWRHEALTTVTRLRAASADEVAAGPRVIAS